MEAIAYIDALLPELVILAASEPRLQAMLQNAYDRGAPARHALRGDVNLA